MTLKELKKQLDVFIERGKGDYEIIFKNENGEYKKIEGVGYWDYRKEIIFDTGDELENEVYG